jgi:ATP synthase protein I
MTVEPPRPTPDDRGDPAESARQGEPDGGSERPPANWALVWDLGLRLGVSVILGVVLGVLVDGWLHTSPIFTLIGTALGVGAAMYSIWDVANETMRK